MKKMIVTDLDGTLMNSQHKLGKKDAQTLAKLEEQGILRVVATGRILYSVQEIIAEDFPIDYLIFSSGAGVLDFKNKEMLFMSYMNKETINKAISVLKQEELGFVIHAPVPENEFCLHQLKSKYANNDLIKRLSIYEDFSQTWQGHIPNCEVWQESASLILVSVPEKEGEIIYTMLKNKLKNVHVVRTTSPLDESYNWIEILPEDVSKAKASSWLKKYCNENSQSQIDSVMAIGNDFNDLDLLGWADQSYVVANAPELLRNSYTTVASNDEAGFSEAVSSFLEGNDE